MLSLRELYAQHGGKVSDKWTLYLRVYDELLSSRRTDPCRFLEIGVQNGGSLEIWAKYFENAACIVGCDIDPRCSVLRFDDSRINVVVADVNSPEAIADIAAISETYDIIIDDGSHVPRDVIASFLEFFPRLSPGGLYIAEDLHCDYFASHGGGIRDPDTATNFFFCLVQLMGVAHWQNDLAPEALAGRFIDEDQLAWFLQNQWIESITFLDSLVVVRRALAAGNGRLGDRIIVGEVADVNADAVALRQRMSSSPR